MEEYTVGKPRCHQKGKLEEKQHNCCAAHRGDYGPSTAETPLKGFADAHDEETSSNTLDVVERSVIAILHAHRAAYTINNQKY